MYPLHVFLSVTSDRKVQCPRVGLEVKIYYSPAGVYVPLGALFLVFPAYGKSYSFWFKQYLFETISHIQYIIFYGTGFDKKLLAYKHHLLDS